MTDIKRITLKQASKLLNSPDGKYEPRGKFIYYDDEDIFTVCTAIDNSTGEAWIEDFGSRQTAAAWLHGHTVKNIFGEVLE